ncbi:MAG: prepilin-type N-terminal cleavage/methylation domain-containing protein [Candidatus Moranbacteria bacterium]|nr:prepilin-type N-terminal cleavage/methylation domain-containing protein [Candidatus Moranbacteria bacterium]
MMSSVFSSANQQQRISGFTLIEAMVVLFIVSLITLTFYETWNLGMQHIANAKYRLGASALANQQMEIIRSLIFDDIGTVSGIPTGTLAQDQTLNMNNTTYNVHTVVRFVDDATDGTLGAGTDIAPNDYKQVTVTVSWGAAGDAETVEMTSIFSLDGVESVAAGTGILSVNVLNAAGIGVGNAIVRIRNTALMPNIDVTAATDVNGNIMFPGAPASVQEYHITVSKAGYYGNMTHDPYPVSLFKPTNVHASVVAGSLSAATLVADRISSLEIQTEDPFGADLPDVDFTVSGGLVIGVDAGTGEAVYDFSQASVTDSGGEVNFSDRSSGAYTFTLDPSEVAQYEFLRLNPEESVQNMISLAAGDSKSVKYVLAEKNFPSALITVTNAVDSTVLMGASVRLHSTALGFDVTLATDTYGQAYFPVNSTPLASGTYDLDVSAAGFVSATDTITVIGANLEKKNISLSP